MTLNKTEEKCAQARNNLISELLCSVSNRINPFWSKYVIMHFIPKLLSLNFALYITSELIQTISQTHTVYADC